MDFVNQNDLAAADQEVDRLEDTVADLRDKLYGSREGGYRDTRGSGDVTIGGGGDGGVVSGGDSVVGGGVEEDGGSNNSDAVSVESSDELAQCKVRGTRMVLVMGDDDAIDSTLQAGDGNALFSFFGAAFCSAREGSSNRIPRTFSHSRVVIVYLLKMIKKQRCSWLYPSMHAFGMNLMGISRP